MRVRLEATSYTQVVGDSPDTTRVVTHFRGDEFEVEDAAGQRLVEMNRAVDITPRKVPVKRK